MSWSIRSAIASVLKISWFPSPLRMLEYLLLERVWRLRFVGRREIKDLESSARMSMASMNSQKRWWIFFLWSLLDTASDASWIIYEGMVWSTIKCDCWRSSSNNPINLMLAAIRVNFAFLELSILQLIGLRVQQVRTFSQCSGAFILVTGGILLNRRNYVV